MLDGVAALVGRAVAAPETRWVTADETSASERTVAGRHPEESATTARSSSGRSLTAAGACSPTTAMLEGASLIAARRIDALRLMSER